METKIYREPENESLVMDEAHLEEYNALALELGFTSQEKAETKKTPIVYPILNASMKLQLQAICPVAIDANKYKRSTIPVEVLKVYKFALDNEMFEGFKIWYDDKAPDPMLIGWNYKSDNDRRFKYDWNIDAYLIARWGDCAMELPELLNKGFELLKSNLIHNAKLGLERCNSALNSPEAYVNKYLSGKASELKIDFIND